jgi:hypothetical protein
MKTDFMNNMNLNMPSQEDPSPDQITQPKLSFIKRHPVVFAYGLLIILVLAILVYRKLHYQVQNNTNPDNSHNKIIVTTQPYSTTTPPSETSTNIVDPGSSPDGTFTLKNCANSFPIMESKSGIVKWVEPEFLKGVQVFASSTMDNDYLGGETSYLVGHIVSGKYSGGNILLTIVPYAGFSGSVAYDHLISFKGNYYFLSKYSEDALGSSGMKSGSNTRLDSTFSLPDLESPETLHMDAPSADFYHYSSGGFTQYDDMRFCGDDLKIAFTDPIAGNVYMADTSTPVNTLYIKRPDSTQRVYLLHPDILDKNNIALVTWSDGTPSNQEYTYQMKTGCGPLTWYDTADIQLDDLVQSGSSINGDPIYEFKNANDPRLKAIYENTYDFVSNNEKNKLKLSDFISNHGVFFWKNQFGQMIRFLNMKYEQNTYCG